MNYRRLDFFIFKDYEHCYANGGVKSLRKFSTDNNDGIETEEGKRRFGDLNIKIKILCDFNQNLSSG